MLDQFKEYSSGELSSEIQRLSTLVAEQGAQLKDLQSKMDNHQHGSDDGTQQIYNDPIRLKPGNYIQGGLISFGEGNTVTIKSGAITTNTSYHLVDTEGAAASDDLENIDLKGAVKGQFLVLRIVSGSRVVTLKDGTGNLRLNADFRMNSTFDTIVLFQDGKSWREICRSDNSTRSGFLNAGGEDTVTISSGVITPTTGYIQVATESAAASDDLDTITATNIEDGSILIMRADSSSNTVVCKDGTGNLQLAGDFSLTHINDTITLIWGGSNWLEVSRSDNSV